MLVLLGECELLGSCVHLRGWLMSQDVPEVESPAGFAALEGSARFQGPAHQGFSGFCCLSGLRDQHTEDADGGLSAAGFVAESLTEVTSCMPARGPSTTAESRDHTSSSATRKKHKPLEHPAGSSEGCGLKTTRLEVDSPAALSFL